MLHEEKGHASSSTDSARRPRSAHALFCDSKPRVSQISCWRFLRKCGDSILSLTHERFGAALGHKPRLHAGDQRLALHSPFHLFPAVLLFWIYSQAERHGRVGEVSVTARRIGLLPCTSQ